MIDINHYIGGDLIASTSGDYGKVDGTLKGQQRVVRRLCTNPGDYIWHPTYGAGLGMKVGGNFDADEIDALIRSQIALETSVAKYPAPVIETKPIPNGIFVRIAYSDAISQTPQTLQFNVNR